jgi:cysteinyl-tRNA synthetase
MSMGVRTPLLVLLPAALAALLFSGCEEDTGGGSPDYRQEMRDFVGNLSAWAKDEQEGFLILPQNGQELFTDTGDPDGEPQTDYLSQIDGTGREDLFYGYEADDEATPAEATEFLTGLLDIGEANGVEALVIDYVSTAANVEDSVAQNNAKGYASFQAPDRDLTVIPSDALAPHDVSAADIDALADAVNLLFYLNPQQDSMAEFLADTADTNYDVLVIDAFFAEELLSASGVASLQSKANGGRRLVISYLSIGEAEDYRYYWDPDWDSDPPSWMGEENPDWEGNFKVRYWDSDWQDIIHGNADSYLQKILDAGFDGAYLDIIDAFDYWENR